MARSSKDKLERRLAMVYLLVACGVAPALIRAHLAKHFIYVSASTVIRYVALCRKRILAQGCVDAAIAQAESFARRQLIFQRAFLAGERRTELAAQDSIDSMYGY
jgi:hypothetical protein